MRNISAGNRRAGLGYLWFSKANFTNRPSQPERAFKAPRNPRRPKAIKSRMEGTQLLFGWEKEPGAVTQGCRAAGPGGVPGWCSRSRWVPAGPQHRGGDNGGCPAPRTRLTSNRSGAQRLHPPWHRLVSFSRITRSYSRSVLSISAPGSAAHPAVPSTGCICLPQGVGACWDLFCVFNYRLSYEMLLPVY